PPAGDHRERPAIRLWALLEAVLGPGARCGRPLEAVRHDETEVPDARLLSQPARAAVLGRRHHIPCHASLPPTRNMPHPAPSPEGRQAGCRRNGRGRSFLAAADELGERGCTVPNSYYIYAVRN